MRSKARGLLRRVRRYLALPGAERGLFLRAFVALAEVEVSLRLHGFGRLLERTYEAPRLVSACISADDWSRTERYAHWLEVASRHHVVRARCLHRSLALHASLLERGLPTVLRIGVRKEDGKLQAHAWVELAGKLVGEAPVGVVGFTPLGTIDGQQVSWRRSTNNVRLAQSLGARAGRLEWQ